MKKSIELTKEDAQLLINLINIALQSKGLEAAHASVYFSTLINTAFAEPQKTEENK